MCALDGAEKGTEVMRTVGRHASGGYSLFLTIWIAEKQPPDVYEASQRFLLALADLEYAVAQHDV